MSQHVEPEPAMPAAWRILNLPPAFVRRARAGTDDLGQPVERHVAEGGEPLRDTLGRAEPGEDWKFFTAAWVAVSKLAFTVSE